MIDGAGIIAFGEMKMIMVLAGMRRVGDRFDVSE